MVKDNVEKCKKMAYNEREPVKCDCGQIVAYKKDGQLILYCKKCKRQIPIIFKSQSL